MTNDEMDNIDRQLAEWPMGLEICVDKPFYGVWVKGPGETEWWLFSPTRSIVQAMMVAEKMRELGWDLQLNSESNSPYIPEKPWYADFSKIKTRQNHRPQEYESHDYIWIREATPELAISLAAKAVKDSLKEEDGEGE